MTTTSSTSASTQKSASSTILSALGGSNAIDWNTLADQLSTAQFAAQTGRLNAQSDKLDKQISDEGSIQAALSNLDSALATRVRSGDLAPKPTLSDPSIAQLTNAGAGAQNTTYSLSVSQLASAQTFATKPVASSTAIVGAGTLTIKFGTITGTSFAEDTNHAQANITIAPNATITDVAAAINKANAGVTAYVANTPGGPRIVMKGQEGAANGFVISATEDPANPGLSQFAWDPASGDPTQLLQGSGDAAYTLDGLAYTSTSNTVSGIVPGITMKLTGISQKPATISFADNSSAITSVMHDLTDALNELVGQVKTVADPVSGDLGNDDGMRALRNALSSLTTIVIMPNATGNQPKTLSDLGLSIQRDGTFALDANRLSKSMKDDPTAVAAMFTNGLYGVYATVDKINRSMTSTTGAASLAASTARYTTMKSNVTKKLSDIADKQEALRQRYIAQFSSTGSIVSGYQSTLTFLQNQIAAWNAKTQ